MKATAACSWVVVGYGTASGRGHRPEAGLGAADGGQDGGGGGAAASEVLELELRLLGHVAV